MSKDFIKLNKPEKKCLEYLKKNGATRFHNMPVTFDVTDGLILKKLLKEISGKNEIKNFDITPKGVELLKGVKL